MAASSQVFSLMRLASVIEERYFRGFASLWKIDLSQKSLPGLVSSLIRPLATKSGVKEAKGGHRSKLRQPILDRWTK
jgi:hypothetical protein